MDPQTPNVVQPSQPTASSNIAPEGQPPQPSSPIGQSPNGNGRKKKLFIALLISLAVIIVGVSIIKPLLSKKDDSNNIDTSKLNTDLYYSRDGYDIKDYGSSIGDPLALNMDKLGDIHKSPQGPIMYACNVLSIKDLNGAKLYVEARSDDRGVMRNYIDSVGQASIQPSEYSLPLGDEANTCSYGLQAGGLLDVTVYQTPFVTKEAIDDQLSRTFIKTDDIGGFSAYKDKSNDPKERSGYMLVSGDTAVEVLFNSGKVSEAQQKPILALAAKNIANLQNTPKGSAIATYSSPTFKKKVARACDLISNDSIKSLTGSDASPYVYEALATGTGIYKYGDKLYNGIQNSCSRYNVGLGSALMGGRDFDHKLDVSVISFNEDTPAQRFIADTAKAASGKVDAKLGEEGFAYRDSAGQNTVVFRQGRFAVEIVYDRTVQKNDGLDDPASMAKKLTPFAQQAAMKLESME